MSAANTPGMQAEMVCIVVVSGAIAAATPREGRHNVNVSGTADR
jgi:hypothetical protein